MRILKVISLLLDYPEQALRDGHAELAEAIAAAREISPAQRAALRSLLDELAAGDLMDVQERYTELFDRGRTLSLLLFEHVHGESRDRGQAMVDLMAQYEAAGFAIGVRELPDYIPLYLEYLATRRGPRGPRGAGRRGTPAGIARRTSGTSAKARMRRASTRCCRCWRGREQAVGELRELVAAEERDDSLEALDKGLGGGAGQLPPGRAAGPVSIHAERAGQGPRGKPGAAALDRFQA